VGLQFGGSVLCLFIKKNPPKPPVHLLPCPRFFQHPPAMQCNAGPPPSYGPLARLLDCDNSDADTATADALPPKDGEDENAEGKRLLERVILVKNLVEENLQILQVQLDAVSCVVKVLDAIGGGVGNGYRAELAEHAAGAHLRFVAACERCDEVVMTGGV
jgi:hypothetical protein